MDRGKRLIGEPDVVLFEDLAVGLVVELVEGSVEVLDARLIEELMVEMVVESGLALEPRRAVPAIELDLALVRASESGPAILVLLGHVVGGLGSRGPRGMPRWRRGGRGG